MLGRGRSAANAEDHQVGGVQGLDSLEVMRRLGIGNHEGAPDTQRLELRIREGRQGLLGLVLVLSDHEDGPGRSSG